MKNLGMGQWAPLSPLPIQPYPLPPLAWRVVLRVGDAWARGLRALLTGGSFVLLTR